MIHVEQVSWQKFVPRKTIYVFLSFSLIGFLLYAGALLYGFVADDNVYILQNPQITQFQIGSFLFGSSYYSGDVTSLAGIYYKPLFTFVVSLLYQLSQGTPFLFHLTQLLLHIANTTLLFSILTAFFKRELSFFLALLFLIHPGNVESVVYIANLQEPLYFFFGFVALALLRSTTPLTPLRYICLFLCLLLSTLSKETGLLFLPTAVLFSFLMRKDKVFMTNAIVFSVILTYLVLRLVVAKVTINTHIIAPIMALSLPERLISVPKILVSYLLLFIFPKDLSWGHHWVVRTVTIADFYLPLLLIVSLGGGILFWYRSQKNKEKRHVAMLFFLGVSLLGLGLHSQIIPLDFTVADRWLYFPIVGFIGLVGLGIERIERQRFIPKQLLLVLAFLVISLLFTRSYIRTFNWKDDYTLASHDVQIDPQSFVLHNNLAYELIKRKEYEKAKPHLLRSIELYPTQSAYDNLAFSYSKLGQKREALTYYRKSLTLGDFYMTYQNYIAELLRQEKYEEGMKETEKALQKYPKNPTLYLLLAVSLYDQGQKEKALQAAGYANSLSPASANFVITKITSDEKISL